MTYIEADAICSSLGGRLALATEVYRGAANADTNLKWTTPGWIAEDQVHGYFPLGNGSTYDGVNGPAIVRYNAERNVDCDGNYSINSPGSAICFGELPQLTNGLITINGTECTIKPNNGTATTNQIKFSDSSELSSIFDNSTFNSSKYYTLLDLDAIDIQSRIAVLDIEEKCNNEFKIEKDKATTPLIRNDKMYNSNNISIDAQRYIITNEVGYQYYAGYYFLKHTEFLQSLSKYYDSKPFYSNPFSRILQAYNVKKDIKFKTYLNMILNNITLYYSDIISKIKSHPIGYICSGVLNEPNYINLCSVIDINTAKTWEYVWDDNILYKQTVPPYPGCGTFKYDKTPYSNAFTVTLHCPGGIWWRDKKPLESRSGLLVCPDGWNKPAWDAFNCYKEWPQLRKRISIRDLKLEEVTFSKYYPTTFLSVANEWVPTAYSDDGKKILNGFISQKRTLATNHSVTNEKDVYRWKPVKYIGTISDKNKNEAKQSALLSAIFNFNGNSNIEQQIRISSTSFNLWYSKKANAKQEFVQTIIPTGRTESSNADLLMSLTIIGAATTFIAGGVSIIKTRQATLATQKATLDTQKQANEIAKNAQNMAGYANYAKYAGAAMSLGGMVGMMVSQGVSIGGNYYISAENADYNDTQCNEFDETLFNLLPYNAREFIALWAMARKIRILEWYQNSVLTPKPNNKNPPEGPYKGSPKAASKQRRNLTDGDVSGNIFNTSIPYVLSECSVINSIYTADERNKVYDSIAQLYYKLNNGTAYITKIIDVYQVGTSLFDVRFTENRRSGNQTFVNQITSINNNYKTYRNMNLSENQLNELEEKYKLTLDTIYENQKGDFIDSAKDCGVKAKYMTINLKAGSTEKQMIFGQIIAINNYGQNVAYLQQPTASSVYIPPYADAKEKTFYDDAYDEYTPERSADLAKMINNEYANQNLSILTDGNYTARFDSLYRNNSTDLTSWIKIDFGSEYDITNVRIMHNIITTTTFTIKLYSKNDIMLSEKDIICTQNTYSADVSFLRAYRPIDLVPCPTNIYSQYKIARFFARYTDPNGLVWVSPHIPIFTGYAEGIDAATTFNPLYNCGFPYNTTDTDGNTLYKPKTVFNIRTTASEVLPNCNNVDRIKSVFKDHLLHVNSSYFRKKPNTTSLTIPYNDKYIYRPASVTAVTNIDSNNYNCAYIWKENVYDESDGEIIQPSATLDDGNNTVLDSQGQITRYGIFRYVYDDENWISKGNIYDVSNTTLYNTEALLRAAIPAGHSLTTLATPQKLYIPYFDSLSLDTSSGTCPETDCSDPAVINSIVSVYNNYPGITAANRIIRVTKALTPSPTKCEYEFMTSASLSSKLSFNIRLDKSDGECKYIPIINPSNNQLPLTSIASYLSEHTPLLSKAYNYASDSVASYINKMASIYSEIYNGYISPQIDVNGNGIRSDIYTYRTTTNTLGGKIRHVSMIDQPVKNEVTGSTCSTMCTSPEIIQSFFTYYNRVGGSKVKEIQNVGMDTSGNCDFTYTDTNVVLDNGVYSLSPGTTRGAKFQIARYNNSCEYYVTGTPAIIPPIPNINDVLNFSTITMFPPRNNPPNINPVTTAQTTINDPLNSRFTQPTIISQSLTESVDYINCLSKYVLNSISSIGVSGTLTAIGNVGPKTCAIDRTGSTRSYYSFIPQTSVVGIAPILTASSTNDTVTTLQVVNPNVNIATFGNLACNITLNCNDPNTQALTGFSSYIIDEKKVSSDTCEYKISKKNTMPFSNTFQTVGFYTGSIANPNGTDLHIKSIKNSNPVTSLYRYFKQENVKSTFIDDYMKLLQLFRFKWNSDFYSLTPKTTQYWKIGRILKIGILQNEDAIVFEAESSLYGLYGSYDVRDYSPRRYFKFTPRIDTENGIDPNNYSISPYTINNIILFNSVDSPIAYGSYRRDESSISDTVYTNICTYNEINYNRRWYDLPPISGTKPSDAPPTVYAIQSVAISLTHGIYNRVRFTVTKSQMTTADARAEIARIMFYDISAYNIFNNPIYSYIDFANTTVEIQDIPSTYLLAQRDANECDPGFTKVMDPELNLTQCVYNSNIITYTQTTPCNTGDTFVSKTGDLNTCTRTVMPTYTKANNVACGIGYFGSVSNTTCTLTGNFQSVTQNPSYIFNTSSATPRLRLPVNKYMLIYFNETKSISGFSFITGSSGTLPLQWKLEGSMNGISWRTIHCRSVDYNYSSAKTINNIKITSFFTPGIFLINQTGSSGTVCNNNQMTTGPTNTAGYSQYNLVPYNGITTNILEGFQNGKSPELPSLYEIPLRQSNIPNVRPVNSQISEFKRIQFLKLQILGTYDPTSKFVHMSQFEILTRSGKIHRSNLRLSNLQGSRNSPREGVNSLLEDRTRRWVDYNKSDIIIQIVEKTDPIIGFRFSIPDGVKLPMNAMPIEWVLYGSYDNRNWIVLHEFNETSLPLINSFATVVFKFNKEI